MQNFNTSKKCIYVDVLKLTKVSQVVLEVVVSFIYKRIIEIVNLVCTKIMGRYIIVEKLRKNYL